MNRQSTTMPTTKTRTKNTLLEKGENMRKTNLASIAKGIRTAMEKHSPEILTGIGITGMITTAVMAVKATPKALILIREKKEELDTDELPAKEIVKTAWRCYIPAGAVSLVSIICLIGASTTSYRRNTALATAYALSESTLKTYQEKVIETIGEQKERQVKDAVANEKMANAPVREVIITEKGDNLCFDTISGRYFKTDIEKLKRAANDLNRRMRDEAFISLNEFYYEIGLDGTKLGDELGWHIDRGYIDLDFSSQIAGDGTPCLVVDYLVAPKYDYR